MGLDSVLDRRFIVMAGKGGTGKTAFALSLGRLNAKQGKKTIVCMANGGFRYTSLLGIEQKQKIVFLEKNLYLLDIDPVVSREEYGKMILKNRVLHKLVFSNKHVNNFLDAVPGLSEWAMLGKASHFALEPESSREFDTVIFDSPATGHGLDMLRLPGAIVDSVNSGRMREEAESRLELLKDKNKTAIIPITLPEEMPVNELIELFVTLRRQKLPVPFVFVNKMLPEIDSDLVNSVDAMNGLNSDVVLKPLRVYLFQKKQQKDNIARLKRTVNCPIYYFDDVSLKTASSQVGDSAVLDAIYGQLKNY